MIGGTPSAGNGGDEFAEVPIGTLNGSNVTFTLTYSPTQYPVIWLFLNGDFQQPGVDFTLAGNIITYVEAPNETDEHYIIYHIGPGAPPLPGTARSFAGGTDKIDWGQDSIYNILGDLSIGIWIKLPSNAYGSIIAHGYQESGPDCAFSLSVGVTANSWEIRYMHNIATSDDYEDHLFSTAIPNNQWRYVGISRDSSAKTVTAFVRTSSGTMSQVAIWTYTSDPADSDSNSRLFVGNFPNSSGGTVWTAPLIGNVQEHYLSTVAWTSDQHLAASNGNPLTAGLVLSCAMGNSPEADASGNSGSGTVTGTTLVQGH